MFKPGTVVRYKKEWCSPEELKYIHVVIENRLNPVSGEMSRYLIETLNSGLTLCNPSEVVDEEMIEEADLQR